jgi:hypothetical protein
MSSRKKIFAKGRIEGAFTPLRHEPMNSPAWKQMSFGARLLYIALLRRLSFTNYNNGQVYLSTRSAAKELGANKQSIVLWYRELQHYGFIELTEPGTLGAKGRAAHWRITDMAWGQIDGGPVRATKDYLNWNGELFNPGPKTILKVGKSVQDVRKIRTVPSVKSVQLTSEVYGKPVHREASPLYGKPVHTKYYHLHKAEARERAAETPAVGIGHNLGPPLNGDEPDDGLVIPMFLRRGALA